MLLLHPGYCTPTHAAAAGFSEAVSNPTGGDESRRMKNGEGSSSPVSVKSELYSDQTLSHTQLALLLASG